MSSLSFCQYCGAELASGAAFCASCGKPTRPVEKTLDNVEAVASPARTISQIPLLNTNEFVMTKKILSLREHYDFASRDGTKLGEGDGNFFQFPAKFVVPDANNSEVMHLTGKLFSIRKEFDMHEPSGNLIGLIKKKLLVLVGSEYWVVQNGIDYIRIYGKFTEHDYRMEVNKVQVAQVHKKWVSLRDQFAVSLTGTVDPRIVIGSVIAIEHEEVTEKKH
jgi:uncharacterized protein YxjI